MKSLKFLFLAIAIGLGPALTTKAADAAAEAILGPLNLIDEIKQSQETLKNLDRLIQLSAKLMVVAEKRFDETQEDPHATAATKADAEANYRAAGNDYQNLLAWRERVQGRIAYDQTMLGGAGISAGGRDAAKDSARDARDSATDAVRQNGAETAHGMVNCPDGH